jgi:hypothetical protein
MVEHGNFVANILNGPAPYGLTTHTRWCHLSSDMMPSFDTVDTLDRVATRAALREKAQLFVSSMRHKQAELLNSLQANKIIIVRAGGNNHDKPEDEKEVAPETSIMVGELSPMGGMAHKSSAYPGVIIAAPSSMPALGPKGPELFSGTSGAGPVAAACVANVMGLLPGITQKEIIIMMEKTAIPTMNIKQNQPLNGRGTINCYKMAQVALDLSENWPTNRGRIQEDMTYLYKDKAREYYNDGLQEYLSRSWRLHSLRKSFLLDPKDTEVIQTIIKDYKQLGFSGNALLYESLLGFSDHRKKELDQIFTGHELLKDWQRTKTEFLLLENQR